MRIPLQHLRYCWECFTFHDKRSPEFEEHCASHIPSITTHAIYRMRVFENTLVLRSHLEEYISRKTWPSKYPDPLCHHIADNEQNYRRHLHNVYHYNKTIYVRPRKLSVKRSCPELDENRATSENRHAQNERPRKIQKSHVSQPPGTGTKELKITFWEPPQPHPEAAQTEQGNQDHSNKRTYQIANYCGLTNKAPCTSQNSNNTLSASYNTPKLTDTSSIHSISSAACSVSYSVPINPQILEPPTATLCYSDNGSKQCNKGSLTEQLRYYTAAEQPKINSACQTSHKGPTMEILRSKNIAVLETDSISNPHSLTLSPLSNKRKEELANNKSLAATESVQIIPKPSEMHTIGSNICEDLASTRPFTRAKAREQAVEALRSQIISQNSTRRAKPYSQKENRLLKKLI
ncbi:hypothetical protein BDV41DRAFT_585867 [Aspergillus transmontanensis]|uniref:Uncharacterized protein n=1 Tax=Aspergillus transmontanensis TaxID=1034304 RepID=A0A5N6W5U0_9EURO|nr:hypothetical protein BDV41DRAFT_585867 [Aspergillus transmontanensis]